MHDSPAGRPNPRPIATDPADRSPGRRLILLRHAKSAYPDDVTDHERPLAPRGRHEAALAGAWLTSSQPPIDAVLCSDARRARETLRHSGIGAPATADPRLYGASAGEIVAILAALPDRTRSVLVVAHAPGLPQAAALLAGPGSEPGALATLHAGFPTSTIAVLDLPGSWAALEPGSCRLLTVHVPRD